jgi:hypothetical protein
VLDEDGDGFGDLAEKNVGSDWRDAASVPEHVGIAPPSCTDTLDNDADGATDAADDGCASAPNDDFADATVVDSLPFSHGAKLVDPTIEPGERQSSCSFADDTRGTVWYQLTVPSDTHVEIETTGSDFISAVSVWREGPFGLTEVDCSYSFPYLSLAPSRFAFAADAGQTYHIQVERFLLEDLAGFFQDWGRLSFHMEATSPPGNDAFATAATIDSLPFTTSVDTIAASAEPLEPDASCRFQGYPTNSVWYRYSPVSDTYVLAQVIAGTDFGVTLGVFESSTVPGLKQIACGDELAFHALAGHTYYLQGAGYQCREPAAGEPGIASICIDSRAGNLALRVDTFELPSCPAPEFTIADPVGDTKPHAEVADPIDITSVSIGLAGTTLCVSIGIDGSVNPDEVWSRLQIDTDSNRATGDRVSTSEACGPLGLGAEFTGTSFGSDEGLLVNRSAGAGYITHGASSFSVILPLASVGGDDTFGLAMEVLNQLGHRSGHFSDCAPNGGHIRCEGGGCAFSPFRNGDANCGGAADSIDAAIVLQFGAGLLGELACPDAADVNGDGLIDSRDAALILQFGAGIIDRLPPPEPRF